VTWSIPTNPLAVDLAVSMDSKVATLDRDNTQFTSMLMQLPVSTAKSFQEQWEEDQFLPKNTALSATAAAGDTALAITTNEGNYAKVGDIGKFVQTGEAFRITTVGASAWTVVRAIGSVAAATAASGTTNGGIIIIGGSNEQGGTLPTAIVTQKTSNYNYTQIFRNSYRFTATAEWVKWYSGNPLAYHRKKIGVEHKREIENALWFGARSYTSGTNAPAHHDGRRRRVPLDEHHRRRRHARQGRLQRLPARRPRVRRAFTEGALRRPDRRPGAVRVPPGQLGHGSAGRERLGRQRRRGHLGASHGAKLPVIVKNDWKRYGEGTTKQIGSRVPAST
jgi:hypothetical protein